MFKQNKHTQKNYNKIYFLECMFEKYLKLNFQKKTSPAIFENN
jgi:hypothetical protein